MNERQYYRRVCGKCLQEKSDDVFHVKKNHLDEKCEVIPYGDKYKRVEIKTEKGE